MLADSRIVYLFLYVTDLAVSRAFYRDKLGLQIIEEDAGCVKFDAGTVILALNRAADHGIQLPKPKDNSNDTVFLVEDVEATRAVLERKGITFLPTSWYQPGGIADFYDPDGHWLTLYEPSKEAMGWPSGDRIRAVLRTRQQRNRDLGVDARTALESGLRYADLFYEFFFVPDPEATRDFYHETLGIRALEGGPCSQACTGDEQGVIKYDTGGFVLTTHHAFGAQTETGATIAAPAEIQAEEGQHACPPRSIDTVLMRGVAPAFYARDVDRALPSLTKYPPVKVSRSGIGTIVTLDDPGGHRLFLYEPSAAALATPSGARIREILATPLPDRELLALRDELPGDRFKTDERREGVPAC
jgi:catechol 2,3-dioxygenase-like lactoylglutathione lyase family enzyme